MMNFEIDAAFDLIERKGLKVGGRKVNLTKKLERTHKKHGWY